MTDLNNGIRKTNLENINIKRVETLFSSDELKQRLPSDDDCANTVLEARKTINQIILGKDKRMLGIIGPCSIHSKEMAIEYAHKLNVLRKKVEDKIYLVMRAYFEKPRTTLGWRGLLIDPDMDNSNNISKGLNLGRSILLEINRLGVPTGSEYLDPVVPNYVDDLVCWASIGARTIESQTHRDMASGVSVPVGFKNSTDGEVINAINAMVLSGTPRGFIGVDGKGDTCIVHTNGNVYTHLILRGGHSGPNYLPYHIENAATTMEKAGKKPCMVVDCSHGNSLKNYKNQCRVLYSVLEQKIAGEERIIGFMLESNLKEGAQEIPTDISKLEYGKSITDACICFKETDEIVTYAYEVLRKHDKSSAIYKYGVYP